MPIRWDKFTVKAQEAVQRANDLASQHGNPELLPVHLLAALLEDKEGIVAPVLEKIGIGPQAVLSDLYRDIEKLPKVSGEAAQAALSNAANRLLEQAFKEAANFKDEYVSTEHLLLAITHLKQDAAQAILARHGATQDAILKALTAVRGSQKVTDQNPEAKYQALERLSLIHILPPPSSTPTAKPSMSSATTEDLLFTWPRAARTSLASTAPASHSKLPSRTPSSTMRNSLTEAKKSNGSKPTPSTCSRTMPIPVSAMARSFSIRLPSPKASATSMPPCAATKNSTSAPSRCSALVVFWSPAPAPTTSASLIS